MADTQRGPAHAPRCFIHARPAQDRLVKRLSPHLLLVLALALLAGCPAPSRGTGSARFAVAVPQGLSSSISRISVTASAADLPSASVDLVSSDGSWSGFLDPLPAGSNRSFLAQAFDASGTLLYAGSASGVPILADQTALVVITLQRVDAPPPFENEAPIIDSLFTSSSSVPADGSFALTATAHDPNPEDSLSYTWSSTEGAFSSPSSTSTSWTAPASTGLQTLTFTVTDSKGLSSSVSLTVNVTSSDVSHAPPVILSAVASSATAAPDQVLTFSVAASDPEESALTFSWGASTGSLGTSADGAFTSSISWTAPSCTGEGTPADITITVTNAFGLTATHDFTVTGLPACEPPDDDPEVDTSSWAPTGAMASPRYSHTATLLPNGKVLVSGGYTPGSGSFATAEEYDPASGTWSTTGSMTTPRSEHTATLLPDGKVLALGGRSGFIDLATAEVYDPVSGAWSATGSMASPRDDHTATVLSNGKVLVAGGYNDSGAFAEAEVYDPTTGTWSATAPMASPRYLHTATLLPGGKVLVAGGHSSDGAIATAELYDPATGTWSTTGSMASLRSQHTATLLPNGKVLVSGGTSMGETAEVYDPATGTWSMTGTMAAPRFDHTATLLSNGKVLVSGGYDGGAFAAAELYDPATGTWSTATSMVSSRSLHTATLLNNGKVLVSGGINDDSDSLAAAELYTP